MVLELTAYLNLNRVTRASLTQKLEHPVWRKDKKTGPPLNYAKGSSSTNRKLFEIMLR